MSWSLSPEERHEIAFKYHFGDVGNRYNTLLDTIISRLRKNREKLPESLTHTIFESGNLIQLWVQTEPCRFSQAGKCSICNYWNGRHIDGMIKSVLTSMKLSKSCETFLLNTCGSCLDPYELPYNELDLLLEWLSKSSVPKVIFETHWTTLSEATLNKIRAALPGRKIFYEIGVESTNPDVLFYSLNKPSSMVNFTPVVQRVHEYGAQCIANVIFGAPFLSPAEQANDARDSIQTLLDMGVDNIVLFPVNVKPYTLAEFLYQHEMYTPVPGKFLAEILSSFSQELLPRINVAWYGDHDEKGVIKPQYCQICSDRTQSLLTQFNEEDDGNRRLAYLMAIQRINCDCNASWLSCHRKLKRTAFECVDFFYSWLSNKILQSEVQL